MLTLGALTFLLLSPAQKPDPVVQSFAFFGCNRVDQKDWEAEPNRLVGSANAPQLRQTFADVSALKPRPKFLFAGGDIVMGYGDDNGQILKDQLEAWSTLVSLPSDIALVPISGNHELNRKHDDVKLPNLATDPVWTAWLDRHGYMPRHGNGPIPAGANPDHLADDQHRLNYSFNAGGTHFIVVNTDTRTTDLDPGTGEGKIARIPIAWIQRDIAAAEANPNLKNIFLLGHRNLVDPDTATGDAPIDLDQGKALLAIIRGSKKVRAFVCAHVHAYDLKRLGGTSGAWQICAGHGGSKLEKSWHPARGLTFGFVTINVHASGAVGVVGFHRPVNPGEKGYVKEPVVAAKPDPEVIIHR